MALIEVTCSLAVGEGDDEYKKEDKRKFGIDFPFDHEPNF